MYEAPQRWVDMEGTGKLPAVDLFAGAGGLSIGVASAGFSISHAVELDQDASLTFARTHPGSQVVRGDISEQSFRHLRGAIALVAGGPPCQPWSSGGLRRGEDDPRNGFPQFLRVVEEVDPEAVLMENVAGLASGVRYAYLRAFVLRLEGLGFHVTWGLLNGVEFGLPQKRVRLFVLATRRNPVHLPAPTHGPGRRYPYQSAGAILEYAPTGDPNVAIVTYARNPDLRPDPYDGHLFNGGGRPIHLGRPAPTLLASMGGNKTPWVDTFEIVPGYHRYLRGGGAPRTGVVQGARRITVREAAALQGFPSSVQFCGMRSSQYRQVGNAVPPPLAAAVARQLAAALQARSSSATLAN
jgi:DNA (cytosine-5)-methyltransferase 1